jgi:hypothetical protein
MAVGRRKFDSAGHLRLSRYASLVTVTVTCMLLFGAPR